MKRKNRLTAGVLSFAVLAGAYALAFSRIGETVPPAEEVSAAKPFIDLSPGTEDDIIALSWTYNGETCILSKDEETGLWQNLEDKDCPIDSDAVQALVSVLSGTEAVAEIDKPGDMAQYGLDTPFITLMAATEERVVSYELGNMTLAGENYMRVDGQNTVYTETGILADAFSITLADILQTGTFADETASVTGLRVMTGAESYTISFLTAPPAGWYGEGAGWFAERDGGLIPLDGESAESFCSAVLHMSVSACAAWKQEDMAALGLDTPNASAEVMCLGGDGKQTALLLEFGSLTENGVYIRSGSSGYAYIADSAVLDTLMHPDWNSLALKTLCPINTDSVTGAQLMLNGETLEIERITETDVSGEPEDYLLADGWTLETQRIEAWLARLRGIEGQPVSCDADGNALMSLVFHLREQSDLVLSVYAYDSGKYLCTVGERTLLCPRTALDSLINDAGEIFDAV